MPFSKLPGLMSETTAIWTSYSHGPQTTVGEKLILGFDPTAPECYKKYLHRAVQSKFIEIMDRGLMPTVFVGIELGFMIWVPQGNHGV